MAGEFGVALDVTGDKSSAADLQLLHPGDVKTLQLSVKFDQAVLFDAAKAFVTAYDKKGKPRCYPCSNG